MFGLPALTPVTTPLDEPTVASAGLLVLHVPPALASESVVVEPAQTVVTPVIEAGSGLTVTGIVMKQVVGNV
jgi:hypothetical protein